VGEAVASSSPIAERYPNSKESEEIYNAFFSKGATLMPVRNYSEGVAPKVVFITYGSIASEALAAERELAALGISAGPVLVQVLKGDAVLTRTLIEWTLGARCVIFIEEGIKNGGFSMIALDSMRQGGFKLPCFVCAIDDSFAAPEEPCNIYKYVGIDRGALVKRALKLLEYDN
jgi:deoxyxylulose-5-phosphate synthase